RFGFPSLGLDPLHDLRNDEVVRLRVHAEGGRGALVELLDLRLGALQLRDLAGEARARRVGAARRGRSLPEGAMRERCQHERQERLHGRSRYTRSMTTAMPWPTPMHMVHSA